MTPDYAKTSFVSFVIGYLLLYYLILWLGATVFAETVTSSWIILGEYCARMKMVLLCSPILAAILGSWAASILILSYTAMGSDRLGASKFFGIGWLCILLGNVIVLSAALQLFTDETVGQKWIQHIGEMRFKMWFWFLAPSFGFAGGVVAVILVRKLIEAQKS